MFIKQTKNLLNLQNLIIFRVFKLDISNKKLESAIRFGATHRVKSDKTDLKLNQVIQKVYELTGMKGADYAFECTAIPELGAAPLALVKNSGTAVQVSGIEQEISFDCTLFEWDKTYINPLYGMCKPDRDIGKILELYENGHLKLDELITKNLNP